jgi:hypothetical protein
MKPFGYALLIAGDLTGTWRGSYGWPGGSYWPADGVCTLRINGNGTFQTVVTPAPGANNLAKASTWSGPVVVAGHHVVLRSSPIVEVPITISFERNRTAA